jgi:hypothetical protein
MIVSLLQPAAFAAQPNTGRKQGSHLCGNQRPHFATQYAGFGGTEWEPSI